MQDLLSVGLRALSFLFLLQAAGVALFVAIFGGELAGARDSIRRLGVRSALLALACVASHYALEAARMSGDFAGIADLSMQAKVLRSNNGAAFALRVFGLALTALGLRRRGAFATTLALAGAFIALAAFLLVGHTSSNPQRWILAPLLLLHLMIVAFWLGALLPLYLTVRREAAEVAIALINAFSALATWLIPIILLAGVSMTALLVPSIAVFGHPYGLLLLSKLAGFLMLLILAARNKWRLSSQVAQGSASAFRRSVLAEYVLIFAVLSMTATMTSLFSPELQTQ